MALNGTTLSASITNSQTTLQVASATGITAPNFTTGANVTYLYIGQEMMLVQAVSGTLITVTRGMFGTAAVAHGNTAPVNAGLITDFPNFTPGISAFTVGTPGRFGGVGAPVAAAATLVPPTDSGTFHVTGTTASSLMSLPPNFVEGTITIIADGIWTWTSSTNANGFAQAGTVTSGGTIVQFTYDAKTALWYPHRVS